MTQQAFLFHHGNHYVRYPDGNRSVCMPYDEAVSYRSIFGGDICIERPLPNPPRPVASGPIQNPIDFLFAVLGFIILWWIL